MPAMLRGGRGRFFLRSADLGFKEARSTTAPAFGGRDLSLPRLRLHHLRPAGVALALVIVTCAWGEG